MITVEAWQASVLAPYYLRDSQKDVYSLLLRERFSFVEAARRFGKTTTLLVFVLEKLLENPGWICRWCFPTKLQATEVLMAEMAKIQTPVPDRDKFTYKNMHSVYVHKNGSKLFLRGVNEDRGDSARGPAANIIICDEYGFWTEPDYIVREALSPQLQNQEGRHLIKASTPPRDLGHLYYIEREEAIKRDRFIQKTIYDNEALSQEELNEIIEECGGVNSPSFRRERMCEPVSDPDMLIVPEWTNENVVPDDYPRPEFFTPYVGGDSGADDNTFVCFGYYDFQRDEVVIENELMLMGQTTTTIVTQAKVIESNLWGDTKPKKRVYDAPKQLIYDIFVDHKWPVQMPRKDDKLAAIHDLRVEVGARRFKVKEKCKNLRRQMSVGMWRDEKHTDFQRSEGLGHLDGVASAIYFNRCIDRKFNPMPHHYGLSREKNFITNQREVVSRDTSEAALGSLFGSKAR